MKAPDEYGDHWAGVPAPGPWRFRAACRDASTAIFFIEPGGSVAEARAVCERCEVRSECLEYAATVGPQLDGVWGGLTQKERRHLRRQRRLAS